MFFLLENGKMFSNVLQVLFQFVCFVFSGFFVFFVFCFVLLFKL